MQFETKFESFEDLLEISENFKKENEIYKERLKNEILQKREAQQKLNKFSKDEQISKDNFQKMKKELKEIIKEKENLIYKNKQYKDEIENFKGNSTYQEIYEFL